MLFYECDTVSYWKDDYMYRWLNLRFYSILMSKTEQKVELNLYLNFFTDNQKATKLGQYLLVL